MRECADVLSVLTKSALGKSKLFVLLVPSCREDIADTAHTATAHRPHVFESVPIWEAFGFYSSFRGLDAPIYASYHMNEKC